MSRSKKKSYKEYSSSSDIRKHINRDERRRVKQLFRDGIVNNEIDKLGALAPQQKFFDLSQEWED